MKVMSTLKRIPGGLMVVPLIVGAALNSLFPEVLQIGGFTTAIAGGAAPLIGAFLFCMGAGIRIRAAPLAMRKGAAITLSKFASGTALGLAIGYFWGSDGFWGLSVLAVISATTNTNGGLYAALAGEFGDETDVASIAIISINDGPFLTMIALGAAGVAQIPFLALLGVVLPILVGMILGNLDEEARHFFLTGGMVLIPIFAFSLGCGLEAAMLLKAGLPGLFLGFVVVFVGGFFNIRADRLAGGTGIAGAAASSTAGNAVATPAALALADPSLEPLAGQATAQVAAACLASTLLTPLLVALVHKNRKQ